jgi:hypothetical protein
VNGLKTLARLVFGTAASVIIVAAMLAFGPSVWTWLQSSTAEITKARELKGDLRSVAAGFDLQADRAESLYQSLQHASQAKVAARLAEVDTKIGELQKSPRLGDADPVDLIRSLARGDLARAASNELELGLLQQEREALGALKAAIEAAANYTAAKVELERLRQAHVAVDQALKDKRREVDRVRAESPYSHWLPGSNAYGQLKALQAERLQLNQASWDAYNAWHTQQRAFRLLTAATRLTPLKVDRQGLLSRLDPLAAQVARLDSARLLLEKLGLAALIVFSAMVSGPAFKLLLYFGLAPWAARRPPICLEPEIADLAEGVEAGAGKDAGSMAARPPPPAPTSVSATSLRLPVNGETELLVKADYLQSVSRDATTTTQWLLNGRFPLSSLAAGMVLLTRVRPTRLETVEISATTDALSELASLEMADGDSIVLQPQHLVGVAQPRARPVRITSHWRLGSLHAWLTLQFRYLVFQGPATLIVKGCRGVRVASAEPPRTISQAATIGFSARLHYSTVRSETFMAYLLGKKALFNDQFAGPTGSFAYQEIPSTEQRSGFTGRTLAGLMDGVLKAFGI